MNSYFDYVKTHPNKPWAYDKLSCNPNVAWDIVEANPGKPWVYVFLSRNKMSKHPFFQQKQFNYVLK